MDDLISRAYVLAEYDRQHKGPLGGARKIMEEAPAVDAAPVIHGRWGGNGDCSECGFQPWYEHDIHTLSYCPNCGAKMDGERRDDDAAN